MHAKERFQNITSAEETSGLAIKKGPQFSLGSLVCVGRRMQPRQTLWKPNLKPTHLEAAEAQASVVTEHCSVEQQAGHGDQAEDSGENGAWLGSHCLEFVSFSISTESVWITIVYLRRVVLFGELSQFHVSI